MPTTCAKGLRKLQENSWSRRRSRASTDTDCILGKPRLSGRQELSQTASFWHPTPRFRLVGGCAFRPITCMSTAAQSREHRSVSAGDVKEPDLIWRRLIPACGDIDSCAHALCQSKPPISHWTAGRFCDGYLGGGAGSMSQGLRVLVLARKSVRQRGRL